MVNTRRTTRIASRFKLFNIRVAEQEDLNSDVEQGLNKGNRQRKQEHEHESNAHRQSTRTGAQPV